MGSSVVEAVAQLYDSMTEREWARMDRHRTEFYVTQRALREHLPPPPARVLDCGGGPGRYAVELARWGYDVTLFDLSTANLALAREKATEAGVTLASVEQGTALDLARFADGSFDAVLLMGPLYHLLEEAERRWALAEARRVVKPGGPLFAAFISRYAAHRDAAVRFATEPVDRPGLYEQIEADGLLPPSSSGPPTFTAYFARPDEVAPLCWEAGFEVATVFGVEGLVSITETQAVNGLTGPAWDWWAEANWRAAPDPSLHGAVEHLLVVARNPRWRPVLREIAGRLDEANVRYVVVGGTSLALHGLPLPVKDLDIETDPEGAYQFAALFETHVVEPVALKEGRLYRSHFGRFDFNGVQVEIMGRLERREGDGWVPTEIINTESVDLEGMPVRVSWLEEETLAYIRRGRLDRAALCLPRCDRDRLLALLRGAGATNAL
jgi:ubiquinone/menaquinone biosynthesis C-methylase UbiE